MAEERLNPRDGSEVRIPTAPVKITCLFYGVTP
jgi:hypothetical protein